MRHMNVKMDDDVADLVDLVVKVRSEQLGRRVTVSDVLRESVRLGIAQIRSMIVIRDVSERYGVHIGVGDDCQVHIVGRPDDVAKARVELGLDLGDSHLLDLFAASGIEHLAEALGHDDSMSDVERYRHALVLPLER